MEMRDSHFLGIAFAFIVGMAGTVYESEAWKSLAAHKTGVIDATHLRDLMQVTPAARNAAACVPRRGQCVGGP